MFKRINFTFLAWDVALGFTARHKWTHFRIHRTTFSNHLVWGKFSALIENWTLELHFVCIDCGSNSIGEVHYGDEGITVCESCRAVERGYAYVNLHKYNEAY